MSSKETRCEKLYKEYQTLREKTRIKVETLTPGKEIKPQEVAMEDLLRKEEVRKELLEKCRKEGSLQLTQEEWFEIENE